MKTTCLSIFSRRNYKSCRTFRDTFPIFNSFCRKILQRELFFFFDGIIIFKGKLSHLSGKNTKNKSGNIPSRQWSIFNGSLRNYIQVCRRCTNGTWIATGILIWHGVLNQSQGRSLQSFSFSSSFTLSYFVGKGIHWHWFATMVSMNKSSV